jgi:hypothetical protein
MNGHSWQPVRGGGADNSLNQSVLGDFIGPGYYAVATPAAAPHKNGSRVYLLVAVFTAAGVLVIVMVGFTYRNKRRRSTQRRS